MGNARILTLLGVENIDAHGNNFNNTINGNAGNNRISDGAGNDQLFGRAGNDYFRMSVGNDNVNGGAGFDTVSYQDSTSGVRVDLRAGTTSGGYADGDSLTSIENAAGSNAHRDVLLGNGRGNVLSGNGGNDVLNGRYGNDTLRGGPGNDLIRTGPGSDTVDGGTGIDLVTYYASGSRVIVDLANGIATGGHAEGDRLTGIENLAGSRLGNDILKGTDGDNLLRGFAGNDRFFDRGGSDILQGGRGNDFFRMGTGNDTVYGGVGRDLVTYFDSTSGVTVDLLTGIGSSGFASGDRLYSVEKLAGSRAHGDTLLGNNGNNLIRGNGGNDFIDGRGGRDILVGGSGADTFHFADKNDGVDRIRVFQARYRYHRNRLRRFRRPAFGRNSERRSLRRRRLG